MGIRGLSIPLLLRGLRLPFFENVLLLTLSDKQRLLLPLLDYAALVGVGDRAAVPRLVEVVSALAVQAINATLT
jgi:hypothetical protein